MGNAKEKKTCYQCTFKGEVPGSCHSRCEFNWTQSTHEKPKGHERGKQMGWYMWPYNYDPVWMIDQCKEFQPK